MESSRGTAGVAAEVHRRATILVIDDDLIIVRACTRMLKSEYEMTGISESGLALELLQRQFFDLVLCDIRMPGLSGLDLIERVSPDQASRFIFLTGGASVEAQAILDRLPNPALEKPFEPRQLREIIEARLQSLALPL